jgi:hypothetical protein
MGRLKYILIISLVIVLADVSCKTLFRKDESLSLSEYKAMGLPDINGTWNENILLKVHVTMANVRMKNFNRLPRKDSRRSGAIFAHLLSDKDLSFLNDTTSLYDKAFSIQSYWNFVNEIGLIYTDNFQTRQYYRNELIEIYIYQLFVRNKMFELADKIDKSNDPVLDGIKRGRQGIVNGYAFMIESLIKKQFNNQTFTRGQMKRLEREVARSLSLNIGFLDQENKREILNTIVEISQKTKTGNISKDLNDIVKLLSE